MSRLKTALLAAVVISAGIGSMAYAQMDSAFDLDQLPVTTGTVAQYLPTPRGDVDGLLLTDGTEVHVPPHLSTELVFAVRPGDKVTIHGLHARAAKLVAAAEVTNDATHVTVAWSGPRHGPDQRLLKVQGTVKAPLYGPRGDINGVLLDDGTVVHLPPPEAQKQAELLAVGKTVVASGDGYSGPLGKSLDARQIGPDEAHMVAVLGPRPRWGEQWWHEHMRHGPGPHPGGFGPGMMGTPGEGNGPPPPPPPAQ